ncbi:hypothetical protein LTR08_007763 [Meristemomyces frigidus]|nr:hypothetical protein LTR08_007763 [Meristemomyces frigidus]
MDAKGPKRDNTTPSCAVCQRRKVKCNRVQPCAPCIRGGLECSFKPLEPRHRAKRIKRSSEHDVGLGASSLAVSINAREHGRQTQAGSVGSAPGTAARVVAGGGEYRFVNEQPWNAVSTPSNGQHGHSDMVVSGATPHAQHANGVQPSEDRSWLDTFGSALHPELKAAAVVSSEATMVSNLLFEPAQETSNSNKVSQIAAHPSSNQTIALWQTYLANVDPVMKVFHAPTVRSIVLGQIDNPHLPPNERALTSAIHLISTVTLTNEECHITLHEHRSELVRRFRQATEDALSAAGFVTTTDTVVLQAFVLYLAALRSLGETAFVWSMIGLAMRIARTIGLARDGSALGLSPFECEMRRRLWWAIVHLNARTAEQMGQDSISAALNDDVQLPSNVSDSELFPGMQDVPEARRGTTDMIYFRLQADLVTCPWAPQSGSDPHALSESNLQGKREALEKNIQDHVIDYCDETVPLQKLTINTARTVLNNLQLVSSVPDSQTTEPGSINNNYSDNTFGLSMGIVQLQLDLWTDPDLQRWRWHWQDQFQWYAFAELIRQIRLSHSSSMVQKAGDLVRNVFDTIIPTIEVVQKMRPLLDAVRAVLDAGTATGSLEQTVATGGSSVSLDRASHSPLNPNVPVAQMATSGSVDVSGPLSVLDPDIVSSTGVPPNEDHGEARDKSGSNGSAPGLDFGAVDWAEFDRLVEEKRAR